MEPQAYCDEIAEKFKETWERVGISNDDFIRTTEPRHEAAVAEMWKRLRGRGRHLRGRVRRHVLRRLRDGEDRGRRRSPRTARRSARSTSTPVERVKEKNYFFRLSKYAPTAARVVRADAVARAARVAPQRGARVRRERPARSVGVAAEEVRRVGHPGPRRSRADDLRLDRRAHQLPHRARRPRRGRARRPARAAFWAASNHLIGKDILRFHAVYWPAMLMERRACRRPSRSSATAT